MGKSREELFQLDRSIRVEADTMLVKTGLGETINEAGYKPAGSYVMHTMTWRDLDFERTDESPDWQRHWEFGLKLAKVSFVWKFSCINEYHHHQKVFPDAGHYWGLQFNYPQEGPLWKIDLWTARPEEFMSASPDRVQWMEKLTEDARFHILEIKDAVCHSSEYGRTLLSVHIYEAVFAHNIRSMDQFTEWWQERYKR